MTTKNNQKGNNCSFFNFFVAAVFFSANLQSLAQNRPEQSPNSLIVQADILRNQGQSEKALEILKKVDKSFPNDSSIHRDLYSCYMKQKKFIEAVREINICIRANPSSAILYGLRGQAKTKLGQFKDALIDYDKATSLYGGSMPYAYFFDGRGHCKLGLGNLQAAKKDLQAAALKYLDSGSKFEAQDCIDAYKQAEIKESKLSRRR